MKNKLFKRLIKKNLNVSSDEELAELLKKLSDAHADHKSFFSDLSTLFETVDQAISDLDRVIEIRDRSLSISSAEMTALANEIAQHASKQEAILARLQVTVNLLTQDKSSESKDGEKSLENLVGVVEQLVQSQINFVKFQKSLYAEGVQICSVLNMKNLERQVKISFQNMIQSKLEISIFFCGNLYEGKDQIEYYQCDDSNRAIETQRLSLDQHAGSFKFMNVDSPAGNGILAIIKIEPVETRTDESLDYIVDRLTPLLPIIAATLENIKLMTDEKHKLHLESEMATIRIVQNTLLPTSNSLLGGSELEISAFYQSATECGGDWWTHFKLNDGRHVILVGDVTGHGTGSAMVCAVVKGYCESFLKRDNLSVSIILQELNSVIYRMSKDINRAMTMSAVAIDTQTCIGTFANAGHPQPIHLMKNNNKAKSAYLLNSGSILGIADEARYSEVNFIFNHDEKLVFYSDGLIEAVNTSNVMYGENKLRRLVSGVDTAGTASDVNKAIITDVRNFTVGEKFQDDLTTVVVRNISGISIERTEKMVASSNISVKH